MRTERYWKKAYSLTLADLRKIFYGRQDRRCACCRTEIEFMGTQSSYDKITETIVCRKCRLAIVSLRKLPAALIPKLLEFVNGNFQVDDKTKNTKESPASVQSVQDEHKGNFPP